MMGKLASKAYVVAIFRLIPEVTLIYIHKSFMYICVVTVSLNILCFKRNKILLHDYLLQEQTRFKYLYIFAGLSIIHYYCDSLEII